MYLAKSGLFDGKPITVGDHCHRVADLACLYGQDIGYPNMAYCAGLTHDFGKISDLFQDVLAKRAVKIDHAVSGAAFLKLTKAPKPMIEIVAGHHHGLLSYTAIESCLSGIASGSDVQVPSGKRSSISGRDALVAAYTEACRQMPELLHLPQCESVTLPECGNIRWKRVLFKMLRSRMLLSCLVDADHTASAFEEKEDYGLLDSGGEMTAAVAESALNRLETYKASLSGRKVSDDIRTLRNQVYASCGGAASLDTGIFTLTAPTGSGKTMGLLNFALTRCRLNKGRRIIFVLPFLSLTNQVNEIVSGIIPGTVMDTSVADLDEESAVRAEKWDAPCIVTTSVQFFDSLSSWRTGDVRKLHNIAGSVIVLDEMQSVPHDLARFAVQTLHFLAEHYGCTVVMSTATQPAYGFLPELDMRCTEIIPDVKAAFCLSPMRPVRFVDGRAPIESVADMALQDQNSCVICNMKRHARQVYDHWVNTLHVDGAYLLSTDLCSMDRLKVIDEIKARQDAGLEVHVAATQCIEAGVDLDFEQVYRALSPLTSIIQAAGRQNRNGSYGTRPVVVFELDDAGRRQYPGSAYEREAAIVKTMYLSGYALDDVGCIDEYYRRLFGNMSTFHEPMDALLAVDYERFSDEMRFIKNRGAKSVIVPAGSDGGKLYKEIRERMNSGCVGWRDIAKCSASSVQSYDMDSIAMHCCEIVLIRRDREIHTGTYVLLRGHENCYSASKGLDFGSFDFDSMF